MPPNIRQQVRHLTLALYSTVYPYGQQLNDNDYQCDKHYQVWFDITSRHICC
ncbi:hypothetical protein YPPY66_0505 [Yersinia pestis PY-66]|uniref:Uncharacterized protein n=2 Tax=Yersinia pestis TaxID=632 RepID=A0AAV3BJR0_YERPE|nr:hypothetical protein YPC_0721 [Yersinia pestis biovar Medievalis str. Harbin 35]EDR34160.1 hypothetical protein YPIP275_3230 [Yersinia pestis biovar Orientalis str. IP275]EDR38539.1 hypothetical protein YpF1991016_4620 [Yersinia pestis biovar Orientalis str. F1991016]EDR42869.1 hypothetical protein YpE1979001_1016 [Yersinia pestis biovar Antiqua str. E1979001]EDR49394.1 hypothetical protein YpB42003004_0439 [Yersinia pestis biovar Antiqua str. B42003004]EDR59265.1 hypothetical protein YpMG0